MTQRFPAYIHSIVAHQIMVSPNNNLGEQYKCALDDFESIMPIGDGRFVFHVKRDRIGVEHYRQWLGLAKLENNRLDGIESALTKLIETLPVPGVQTGVLQTAPAIPTMPRTATADDAFMSAEDMAATLMEGKRA